MKKMMSGVTIKDAINGIVEAVFARYDVIDRDGDVTVKGAFTEGAPIVVSAYGHKSWDGALPVGKGHIEDRGDTAVAVMKFFMDTTPGRDTFLTVKNLAEDDDLQEWSYSLNDVESERGQKDGRNVRFLKKVGHVKEVSPVLMGAGIDTGTLLTKGRKRMASDLRRQLTDAGRERWANDETYVWLEDWDVDESFAIFEIAPDDEAYRLIRVAYTAGDSGVVLAVDESEVQRTVNYAPKGARFLEQAKSVLADVDTLTTRATEVMALRASKGKQLSDESVGVLTRLDVALGQLKAVLEAETTTTSTPEDDAAADEELAAELLRSELVRALNGAPQP